MSKSTRAKRENELEQVAEFAGLDVLICMVIDLEEACARLTRERDEARRQRDEGGHAECPHKRARVAAERERDALAVALRWALSAVPRGLHENVADCEEVERRGGPKHTGCRSFQAARAALALVAARAPGPERQGAAVTAAVAINDSGRGQLAASPTLFESR